MSVVDKELSDCLLYAMMHVPQNFVTQWEIIIAFYIQSNLSELLKINTANVSCYYSHYHFKKINDGSRVMDQCLGDNI